MSRSAPTQGKTGRASPAVGHVRGMGSPGAGQVLSGARLPDSSVWTTGSQIRIELCFR